MNPQVRVWTEELVIPTYLPQRPDKNPMFLEKRVYQGSTGKVYPLPFTDRIAEKPVDRKWKAVWLENVFLRVMILPEIGGRIHAIQDRTNGYDLIYRQRVIKPALVGLAGPWISGGIEFNWSQHHRPATFLPVDFQIEAHADGSQTVWCSDHDPMTRMKGMHGVCLHPGKAFVELKVRAYNRTPLVQTFLWWANVATRVHEAYQSFFPPDVDFIADHAKRAMSGYPLCQAFYYGVNYGERGCKGVPANERPSQFIPPHSQEEYPESNSRSPIAGNGYVTQSASGKLLPAVLGYAPNDLSWYANIPTPCSYMAIGSKEDFFGGYDHYAQTGLIHIANHHISPGKKQWTWGNHEFGYAWDRNLTDQDGQGEFGPYIELMAGVYTDNQPDFSFLQPGETKTWSQFWYPIRKIGPARHANLDAAVNLKIDRCGKSNSVDLGVAATRRHDHAVVKLLVRGRLLAEFDCKLSPARPFLTKASLPPGMKETDLTIEVADGDGGKLISYTPKPHSRGKMPAAATEPPAPADIETADELYITGLHLEQYRHATRCPTLYWHEALKRDPFDARCNNAMGLWHLRRGEFPEAESHFRKAIERLTRRNPNPYDGEAYYNLGLCLRFLGRPDEAYDTFYKATWNQAWQSAGYHALAELDCKKSDWQSALDHLNRSLRFNTDNTRARNLKTIVLQKLGRGDESGDLLRETLALDPLDWWARQLAGHKLKCDLQVALDLAHEYAGINFFGKAIAVLQHASANKGDLPDQSWGASPLVQYTLGGLHEALGDGKTALKHFKQASALPPDYCFPSRLEQIAVLKAAMAAHPKDARAPYYLGNLLYDRRRHAEAIKLWERSVKLDPGYSVAWRNLGIGYFNISKQSARARMAYNRAFRANPTDARLLYERDQLWKRLDEKPEKRLRELEKYPRLTAQRDDLSVELCALYNQTGRHWKALQLLCSRKFQPWEGGEGQALGQHVRTRLALGRVALAHGDLPCAVNHFAGALTAPENLGEAKHLLANQSDIHYWLGIALDLLGEKKSARKHWLAAATFKGDFQEMGTRAFSETTYYSALAWERLGQKTKAKKLLRDLLAYAEKLETTPAKIDYFATSLPAMLLFEDDIQLRQETTAHFLQAQAHLGLNHKAKAKSLLLIVLQRDPNHAPAKDLFNQMTFPAKRNHVGGQRKVNGLNSRARLFWKAMPVGKTLLPFRGSKNDSLGHPTNSFPRRPSLSAKLNLKPGSTPAVVDTNCRKPGKALEKSNGNWLTDCEPK